MPYTDSHPDARGGFGEEHKADGIMVVFPREQKLKLPDDIFQKVLEVLKQDPRAAYNKKPDYVYGMSFAGYDIRFTVEDDILYVKDVVQLSEQDYKKIK